MTNLTPWRTLSALFVLALVAGCATDEAESAYVTTDSEDISSADGLSERPSFDESYESEPRSVAAALSRPAASSDTEPILAAPSASRPASATPSASAPASLGRHLRRSADVRVSTPRYAEALREARAVAGRYGGLVTGEDGSTDGNFAQTTLTLRVPSDRFDPALDALAALGDVQSRQVSVDDVTGQVVDLEARLRAQRAAEARYVAFVGQAGSIAEMLEVQHRLDGVRAEIEAMESHARSLRSAVSLSTIRATIVGTAVVVPPPAGVWARVADGLAAGWNGVLAVVIGVLPLWPLAVVAGIGVVLWRRLSPPVAA